MSAATITANDGSGTSSPDAVLGYEASRESRNLVHELVGGGIAVTLLEADLRTGTLELRYIDRAAAFASLAMHGRASTFTIVDPDVEPIGMTYVLVGDAGIRLDTRIDEWVVTAGFQEIVP